MPFSPIQLGNPPSVMPFLPLWMGFGLASSDGSSAVSVTPTDLDIELLPEVLEIINEVGKTVDFITYPSQSFSVATGSRTDGTPVTYSRKIIPPYNFDQRMIDGDVIQYGDMQTGVAGQDLGFVPARGTHLEVDGVRWTIQKITPIMSGELTALYMIQLRQ